MYVSYTEQQNLLIIDILIFIYSKKNQMVGRRYIFERQVSTTHLSFITARIFQNQLLRIGNFGYLSIFSEIEIIMDL